MRLLEPDADNTDEGRKTMKEQLSVVNGQLSEAEEGARDSRSEILDRDRLPNSQKVYIETNGLRVPFRQIALTPSKAMDGSIEDNPPVRVYDTSGPWTDPDQRHDVREGLPAHRREWIIARGDVEEYEGREVLPLDNGYLTKGAEEIAM